MVNDIYLGYGLKYRYNSDLIVLEICQKSGICVLFIKKNI